MYSSGYTHVNFTAEEMAAIQQMRDELGAALGVRFNSSRQAIVALVTRYFANGGMPK
jgi:hypothetical protein